jgi:hypothetical protein
MNKVPIGSVYHFKKVIKISQFLRHETPPCKVVMNSHRLLKATAFSMPHRYRFQRQTYPAPPIRGFTQCYLVLELHQYAISNQRSLTWPYDKHAR